MTPRFSIILPVKNGAAYLEDCLTSILSQTFRDFNLVILENLSTDNTPAIIRSFDDPRLTVYFSQEPLSIEQNWQRIRDVPKAEFMTLIGHDDLLQPDYLTIMDRLIARHPDASLYQTHFRFIDANGALLRHCKPMEELQRPPVALQNFLGNRTDVMGTGFMMRSRDFDAIGGMPAYPNLLFADLELWIRLSLRSYLAVDPSEAFAYRRHSGATTATTSPAKLLAALQQFVSFLRSLQQADPSLTPVIRTEGKTLLLQYCRALTHGLLRVPKAQRSVQPDIVIAELRAAGRSLGIDEFDPLDAPAIRMGKIIDDSAALRQLFLWFKRIVPGPVIRK